jgi:hypothetical protein
MGKNRLKKARKVARANRLTRRYLALLAAILTALVMALPAYGQCDVGMAIFNKQICVGMTWQNVVAAWGKPVTVRVVRTQYGATEFWYMKNGALVELENARVVAFVQ